MHCSRLLAAVLPHPGGCMAQRSTPPCHHAGTALGDPIELGAALTVLQRTTAPLRLTAAKSRAGHSEPVSGTVGLGHAAAMLANSTTSAVMHLRSFNPMLIGLIQAHRAAGHACPYIGRQDGTGLLGAAAGGARQATSGVSAFAFQGTNAHAVLVKGSGLPTGPPQLDGQWQRQRAWFALQPHPLVSRQTAALLAAQFQVRVQGAALSYLWDHIVQHRPLLPGAAMFEAAYAAGALLQGSSSTTTRPAAALALTTVSIPSPLVLSGASSLSSTAFTAAVDLHSGRVALQSSTATALRATHLGGTFACSQNSAPAGQGPVRASTQPAPVPKWWHMIARDIAPTRWQHPGATATIAQTERAQDGQYHTHPAVIDNATQASDDGS